MIHPIAIPVIPGSATAAAYRYNELQNMTSCRGGGAAAVLDARFRNISIKSTELKGCDSRHHAATLFRYATSMILHRGAQLWRIRNFQVPWRRRAVAAGSSVEIIEMLDPLESANVATCFVSFGVVLRRCARSRYVTLSVPQCERKIKEKGN